MSVQVNWFNRVKQAVNDNIPVIVTLGAVATATVAVVYAKEAMDSLEESTIANKQALRNIEETIQVAIEAPTIVKVEIGDDIELIGMGNRTD